MTGTRMHSLLDAAGQPWCALSADLWIEDRNTAFVTRFGTLKRFLDLVPQHARANVEVALCHGPVGPLRLEHEVDDGRRRTTVTWIGMRRVDGGVDLLCAVGAIGNRRIDELERINKQLEEFVYVVTHDLNEPVRAVTSFTQLLKDDFGGELGPDAKTYIEHAATGGARIQALLRDLLGYSRVYRRGKDFKVFEMTEAFATAIEGMTPLIAEHKALVLDGVLPRVVGDEDQIVAVLQHLLHNALKFRSKAPPRIELDVRSDGTMWLFAMTDNGIGIQPQHVERAFGIFKQLHPRGHYSGTGVGLALSRRIIERHGGHIRIEPAPSGGLTVKFTLPKEIRQRSA